MSRFAWFSLLFVALVLSTVLIMLSESHSWSGSATTWGLTAIFGIPTAIDFSLWRWRRRSGRRRDGSGGAAHPTK